MTIYHSVTELIGHTPVIQLHKLDTGLCSLFLKLENQNPGGSIKDRVALSMINEAERTGQLQPGGTIIEATAGNTRITPGVWRVNCPARFTSTSSTTKPIRWRTVPPPRRSCLNSLTVGSTPSWWAWDQAARWVACRRGSPNTRRTRSLSSQTRQDLFWPTRWKPDATATRAPSWLRELAKTLFPHWPTLTG